MDNKTNQDDDILIFEPVKRFNTDINAKQHEATRSSKYCGLYNRGIYKTIKQEIHVILTPFFKLYL
jgi:hypothetical protein